VGAYGGTVRASKSTQQETPASIRVAYVFSSDVEAAQAFQSLLETCGCSVTLVSLGEVAATGLAAYDVVIAGNDTGYMTGWGDAQSVAAMEGCGKPLIGLGEGGYALFGRLGLAIGHPNGGHASDNSIYVVDPNAALFNTPHPIARIKTGYLSIYRVRRMWHLRRLPDRVVPRLPATGSHSHYPLVSRELPAGVS
jgi:hypothetical protein